MVYWGVDMLLDNEIQNLINELKRAEIANIQVGGISITAKVFEGATKLFLSTPVYYGGNFIPKSVRHCLKLKAPFNGARIKTSLLVDEEKFQIDLNYLGFADQYHSKQRFIDLLEEFSLIAEKWRDYLDEQDRNDLVYIPVK